MFSGSLGDTTEEELISCLGQDQEHKIDRKRQKNWLDLFFFPSLCFVFLLTGPNGYSDKKWKFILSFLDWRFVGLSNIIWPSVLWMFSNEVITDHDKLPHLFSLTIIFASSLNYLTCFAAANFLFVWNGLFQNDTLRGKNLKNVLCFISSHFSNFFV